MNTFNTELRVVDRGGSSSRVGAVRFHSYVMALRPGNGVAVATSILDPRTGTQELWLIDLEKNSAVPLTTTRGFAAVPVWSSDGRRLAYAYQPPGQLDDVYVRDMGTGATTPLFETPGTLEHPSAWSHDGKSLLFFMSDEKGTYLSTWSFASRTPTPFAGPRALEVAAFSPHDDFVAFTSQESGRPEAYVTTFPDRRQTWPLTTDGGRVLSWSQDGREILVGTLSGHIAAYPVSTAGGFTHGPATILVRDVGSQAAYSTATRDHSKIIIRVSPGRREGPRGDAVAVWLAGRFASDRSVTGC